MKGKLLGLAGKTGSGKNHVAGLLVQRGWRSLDLDLVAHRALEILQDEIVRTFGTEVLINGKIDRRLLGGIVFSSPENLEKLEQITYPWIDEETRRWIDSDPEIPAVIHAINLHKTTLPRLCDAVIWVKAPRSLRKKRVIRRDNRPWEQIKGRFSSQRRLNTKLFSQDAETYSVRNSGNDVSLNMSLDRILHRLYDWEG
jgi:dephospho-CoA kinase